MKRLTVSALLVLAALTMLLSGCSQGRNEKNNVTITGDGNQVDIVCKPKNGK